MIPTSSGFNHLGIAPKMLDVLTRLGFTTPTPIQNQAIPIVLEGKDIIGIAQTGTGKTLAFGIPIVQLLSAHGGRALILVPTRELALQVEESIARIARAFSLTPAVLIGGAPMFRQVQALRRNPAVIVATPGRLIDHLEQRNLRLDAVRILVADEADRMLDMGFAPQVQRILREMPKKRQTLLFSATMPAGIVDLATRHMKLPVQVEIAPPGTAAEKVSQELFIIKKEKRKAVLKMLLERYRGSVLVFTRTKVGARKVTRMIRDMGQEAAEIHSNRSMGQRKQAIEGFRTGRYRILVATDIAARGIDVSGIELVINFDLPDDSDNYVHRIGRTGRAGEEGHAVSFAAPEQRQEVEKIERLIRRTLPRGSHPEVPSDAFSGGGAPARSGGAPGRGRRPQSGRFRPRRQNRPRRRH